MIQTEVKGLAELNETLRNLPAAIQSRLLRGAVATAAAIFKDEAIRRAPVYTGEVAAGHPPPGTLKKAIYQTRLPSLCTPTIETWKVSVRRGKAAQNHTSGPAGAKVTQNLDAFYASWVEFGHYTRAPKGIAATQFARRLVISSGSQLVKGAHYVVANPFMRPAFESQKAAAAAALKTYIADNLPAAVEKAKGKGA